MLSAEPESNFEIVDNDSQSGSGRGGKAPGRWYRSSLPSVSEGPTSVYTRIGSAGLQRLERIFRDNAPKILRHQSKFQVGHRITAV